MLPEWVKSYILAVGTVEPRKGFPTLVDAFGHLAASRPGLALVIAGANGWGSAELERAIASCRARTGCGWGGSQAANGTR